MNVKGLIADHLAPHIEGMDAKAVLGLLEYPPNPEMGDISLPCFKLSKILRKAPQQIAEQLKQNVAEHPMIRKVEAVSGYLNFYLDPVQFAGGVIAEILRDPGRYGSQNVGQGKTIVVDFSSPNIAKPFHIGHLRSTVIGNALVNIFTYMGYRCVRINHLGDWGTQFGKLMSAYLRWGNKDKVEQDGIDELLRLYVKFHEEAEKHPELEDEGRAWFVKLEQGDEEAKRLWEWFISISLKEFEKIYSLLGVTFDSYAGESFYNDKMEPIIEELKSKNMLEQDEGAWLVRLDEFNMPPALILKKDGSSLYHTRDIAAAFYRKKTYNFDKAIYVVDYAQNLHFQQWFKVIELMGYEWAKDLIHVPFGRVSLEGVSLSTRKGNVVKLEDLLTQAIEKTREIIEEKNPSMENKDEVARQVGVGAVIFSDLSGNRIKDIVFSWEEALNFDGETGPYVQYTHARACSVIRKAGGAGTVRMRPEEAAQHLMDPPSLHVLKQLYLFPEKVYQAMEKLEPSIISRYLIDLSQSFNRFYHECPILVEDEAIRNARLTLVQCVIVTLAGGLRLIGLEAPEQI